MKADNQMMSFDWFVKPFCVSVYPLNLFCKIKNNLKLVHFAQEADSH